MINNRKNNMKEWDGKLLCQVMERAPKVRSY